MTIYCPKVVTGFLFVLILMCYIFYKIFLTMLIGYIIGSMFPTTIKKNTLVITSNHVYKGGYVIETDRVGKFYFPDDLKLFMRELVDFF